MKSIRNLLRFRRTREADQKTSENPVETVGDPIVHENPEKIGDQQPDNSKTEITEDPKQTGTEGQKPNEGPQEEVPAESVPESQIEQSSSSLESQNEERSSSYDDSDDSLPDEPKNRTVEEGWMIWEKFIKENFEEQEMTPWERDYVLTSHLDPTKLMIHDYAFEKGLSLNMELESSHMLHLLDLYLPSLSDNLELSLRMKFADLDWPQERIEELILQCCLEQGTRYSGPAKMTYRQRKKMEEEMEGGNNTAPIIEEKETTVEKPKKKKTIKKRIINIVTLHKVRKVLKTKK